MQRSSSGCSRLSCISNTLIMLFYFLSIFSLKRKIKKSYETVMGQHKIIVILKPCVFCFMQILFDNEINEFHNYPGTVE